jgi:hypothetical protein
MKCLPCLPWYVLANIILYRVTESELFTLGTFHSKSSGLQWTGSSFFLFCEIFITCVSIYRLVYVMNMPSGAYLRFREGYEPLEYWQWLLELPAKLCKYWLLLFCFRCMFNWSKLLSPGDLAQRAEALVFYSARRRCCRSRVRAPDLAQRAEALVFSARRCCCRSRVRAPVRPGTFLR